MIVACSKTMVIYPYHFFIMMTFLTIGIGCTGQQNLMCKPVLFPYPEYGYAADVEKLEGNYIRPSDLQSADFFSLKISIPRGWRYESLFGGRTLKIFSAKDRFFWINFEKAKQRVYRSEDIYLVGCNHFDSSLESEVKTDREYWADLYLFTSDQIRGDPTFWQSCILWSKTNLLRDADKLIHYTGNGLEAFQKNVDAKTSRGPSGVVCTLQIFPEKIAPNYLTMAAPFVDDEFFKAFLEMLSALNR